MPYKARKGECNSHTVNIERPKSSYKESIFIFVITSNNNKGDLMTRRERRKAHAECSAFS